MAALVMADIAKFGWQMGQKRIPKPQIGAERIGEDHGRASGRAVGPVMHRPPGPRQNLHGVLR